MRNEHSFRVDVILVSYKNDHRHSHSGEEKKRRKRKSWTKIFLGWVISLIYTRQYNIYEVILQLGSRRISHFRNGSQVRR